MRTGPKETLDRLCRKANNNMFSTFALQYKSGDLVSILLPVAMLCSKRAQGHQCGAQPCLLLGGCGCTWHNEKQNSSMTKRAQCSAAAPACETPAKATLTLVEYTVDSTRGGSKVGSNRNFRVTSSFKVHLHPDPVPSRPEGLACRV